MGSVRYHRLLPRHPARRYNAGIMSDLSKRLGLRPIHLLVLMAAIVVFAVATLLPDWNWKRPSGDNDHAINRDAGEPGDDPRP
jgi:hypothetical protein